MGTVSPNDEPEQQVAALRASNGDAPEAPEGAQDGPGAEEPAGAADDAADAGGGQDEPQGAAQGQDSDPDGELDQETAPEPTPVPGAELNGGDGIPAEGGDA